MRTPVDSVSVQFALKELVYMRLGDPPNVLSCAQIFRYMSWIWYRLYSNRRTPSQWRGSPLEALKYHAFQLIACVVANYLTKYVCLNTPVSA
jgi:hypothetical protein